MQTIEAQTKTPSLDDLFRQIYSRRYQSVWTACLGVNQSGKTDFNLLQLERLHALGLGDGFGSNIKGLKADFDIDFIEDYETLKKRCMMLNPDPEAHGLKRYFFVADEMGDWAAERHALVERPVHQRASASPQVWLMLLGDWHRPD